MYHFTHACSFTVAYQWLPLSICAVALFLCFSETLMKYASCVGKDELISFGTCFGKFTKTQKFRLHITALDFLAPYAKVTYILRIVGPPFWQLDTRVILVSSHVLDNT